MAKNSSTTTTVPGTVWLARGRHLGTDPEQDVRRNLIALKAAGVLDDFADLDPVEASRSTVLYPREESAAPGPSARRLFEARWRVADGVMVRAQLTTYEHRGRRADDEAVSWILAAEAELPWDFRWPSPATMFWPDSDRVAWDHDAVPGVRLRTANRLPADDSELRRHLRDCTRDTWYIHVVVHEAMTPDVSGQRPVSAFLPPSLRHRVVEHRATPAQAETADFAMKRELGVRMPRGGAVILPVHPRGRDHDAEHFSVHTVFLDGSEPTELLALIEEFANLPRPLPDGAEQALTQLRKGWHLLTPDEELTHAQSMAVKYAEALDAMTKSCDLYREAADAAQAALAEFTSGGGTPRSPAPETPKAISSPLNALRKGFDRLRDPNRQDV
ncbi:hypothetical protein ACFU9Y_13145 [Streptomyces sp. NPDC057621]|uniref:hypothetical protein n=1 Tax=Streptomyces sp. NPDC057621 TaxID=3346186 RepID=UPI00369E146A